VRHSRSAIPPEALHTRTQRGARARVVFLVALALTAAGIAGCGSADGQLASLNEGFDPEAPNIVVVMTDDQAADTMRAMPQARKLLGEEGTTFTQALVSFPLCCPSRASFLTGQYAHNHGVLDNHAPAGGIGALDQRHTLPVWLNEAGYRTAFAGKYLNGYGKRANGGPGFIPPGWSDWYAAGASDKTSAYDYDLNENGTTVHRGSRTSDYKTDALADAASRFLRDATAEQRPFFLWVATSAPHTDNGLPDDARRNPVPARRDLGSFAGTRLPRDPAFNERDTSDKPGFIRRLDRIDPGERAAMRRRYVSELESLGAVDDLVATLYGDLRHSGDLRDTIFVLTSDNGFLRGQHRVGSGKALVYDESVRVPLLVRGPGFRGGRAVDDPVVNVDLTKTIAEASGIEPDLPLDGVPLADAVRGREPGRGVLLEVFERRKDQFSAIRTNRYMYAERRSGRNELYDHRVDPDELDNIANDPSRRAVRSRLAERLDRLRTCAGADCR
jgi:arylsulfatase A-like enzyme